MGSFSEIVLGKDKDLKKKNLKDVFRLISVTDCLKIGVPQTFFTKTPPKYTIFVTISQSSQA